jgi:hypothetical protein
MTYAAVLILWALGIVAAVRALALLRLKTPGVDDYE